MKKKIIAACVISFLAGVALDRIVVHSELKKLEAEVTTAVGKMFGYENQQAMELMKTVTAEYTPEEFVQLLEEAAALGRKTVSLFNDERLVGTLRNLTYLERLEEEGADALNETIRDDIRRFYEDYEHLLDEQPSSRFEETSLAALRRIQAKLNFTEQAEVDPVGAGQRR